MNILGEGSQSFASKLVIPGINPDGEESASHFMPPPRAAKNDVLWKMVSPAPGFCMKTKTLEGDKVFFNIGHTDGIPAPEDISNDQLIAILESEDKAGFKVPMSIGEAHYEADKSGNLCTVYDVVINSTFIEKLETNELFRSFFIYITLQAVMDKYNFELDVNPSPGYVILKNRKCIGTMREHRIEQRAVRKQHTPLIELVQSSDEKAPSYQARIDNLQQVQDNPYNLYQFPKEGRAIFYLAIVPLPQNSLSTDVSLKVGEDRILLSNKKTAQILMDTFFPEIVDPKTTTAVFHEDAKLLLVRVDVLQENEP